MELLNTNGIVSEQSGETKQLSGTIESIAPIVLEGNTYYYLCLEGQEAVFVINMSDVSLVPIIRYEAGENISLEYTEGYGLNEVTAILDN